MREGHGLIGLRRPEGAGPVPPVRRHRPACRRAARRLASTDVIRLVENPAAPQI